jgi:acetyl esterase
MEKTKPRLDPACKKFVNQCMAENTREVEAVKRQTGQTELTYPLQREILERSRKPWTAGGPDVSFCEQVVKFRGETVSIRIYRPVKVTDNASVLIYLHGGGWVYYSNDTHDRLMREYANRAGIIVIGVNYSLSPEVRYPKALNEVVALVHWVSENSADLAIDKQKIVLGGDSAGGNLAAAAALKLRDDGFDRVLKAIILNYPVTDYAISDIAAQRLGSDGDMLTFDEMEFFWDHYLPQKHKRREPYASPVNGDLHNLPAALMVIAECDLLAEQNQLFSTKYALAGSSITVKEYAHAPHSFLQAIEISSIAEQAFADTTDWLLQTLAEPDG